MEKPAPRVLVVDDEPLIGMLLQDMLEDLGYEILGPIIRLEDALATASDCEVQMAILDVNIAGRSAIPVADILAARGVPFVFATGYGHSPANYADVPVLHKPFQRDQLERVLSMLLKR